MEFIPETEEVKRPYITGRFYDFQIMQNYSSVTISVVVVVVVFSGSRQNFLYKRKKDSDEWRSRWFVLSHDYLSYYLAYQVKVGIL